MSVGGADAPARAEHLTLVDSACGPQRPTDVEISRACNALSITYRDQRIENFDAQRAEQIVTGALGGERKLTARATSQQSGELRIAGDGTLVALMRLQDGQWVLERKLDAGGSQWALPVPAAREPQAEQGS
jgi:hypothetical protein